MLDLNKIQSGNKVYSLSGEERDVEKVYPHLGTLSVFVPNYKNCLICGKDGIRPCDYTHYHSAKDFFHSPEEAKAQREFWENAKNEIPILSLVELQALNQNIISLENFL